MSTISPPSNHHLIFVYGTLKSGFPNHSLLETLTSTSDAAFISSQSRTLRPFPLVCGPFGVPFLLNIPGSGHRVYGELYTVSDFGLGKLDELEGVEVGNYERLGVEVKAKDGGTVTAEAYFGSRSYAEEMWRRCGEKGWERYGEEEAKGYVRRKDRKMDGSFFDHIRRFVEEGEDGR